MAQDRKAELRARRRKQGFKPLEVWLPASVIEKLDQMKTEEITSREAVIMALVQDTMDLKRPANAGDQLALL